MHGLYTTIIFLLMPVGIRGMFNRITCLSGSCVQQNKEGTWCYVPEAGQTALLDCKGTAVEFQSVLDVHLGQSKSIAYYRGADNSQLGGVDYLVPSNPGIVRLCVSGIAGDGNPLTVCTNVLEDNSLGDFQSCKVANAPRVSDGCYVRAASSINSVPTPSSTPPASSASSSPSTPTPPPTSSSPSQVVTTSSNTQASSTTASPSPTSQKAPSDNGVVKDIVVPVIVAVLGLMSAILTGQWWRKKKRRLRNNV